MQVNSPDNAYAPPMADKGQILDKLNDRQKEAVVYGEGPLLIFAGAGSGKTRVITHRIAWLIANGVHPAEILAITFTNKAAQEMKDRLTQLLGPVAQHMWVGTFHSMLLRILRRHAELLGFKPSFAIFDTDDQKALLKRLLKELKIDDRYISVNEARNIISSSKNKLLGPEDLAKQATYQSSRGQDLLRIYRAYQANLLQQNALDFDDILYFSVKLFREHPDILAIYAKRFRYLLVDEYQDTNEAQYQIVKLLSSYHRNLCVVGDDDQSIYGFRGADYTNILNFREDFPDCKVIKLEQNYRSTEVILEAANLIIANNEAREEKRLWTSKRGGEKISFYRAQDQYDESRWVAQEIKRLSQRTSAPLPLGEVGILYRVNALSRNIEFALREAGIPYQIFGGLRFYDRLEIRDVFAYLRLLESPEDRLAFARAVNTPKRGIGDSTVEKVLSISERTGRDPLSICLSAQSYPELSRVAGRLTSFGILMQNLAEVMEQNKLDFADFIRYVEEESGLENYWKQELSKGNLEAEARLQNLEELRSDALEFASRQEAEARQLAELADRYEDSQLTQSLLVDSIGSLGMDLSLRELNAAFLENASLYTNMDQAAGEQAISLMTVHSAKGLEFDAAFVIGMEEGIFPGYRAQDSKEEMEEERRLAYVAITRARKYLGLTAARSRLLYGKTSYNPVSCFMAEIPDHLVEELGGSRFGDGEFLRADSGFSYGLDSGYGNSFAGGFGHDFGGNSWSNAASSSAPKKEPVWHSAISTPNPFSQPRPVTTASKNQAGKKAELSRLEEGTRVRHRRYGEGVVIGREEIADDVILTIDFSGKTKHLTAGMAKLEVLD
ncbi:MAG: UvrD-helicase domain-containing protein [Eubacteriales bacterium]|nr:UvrD-helicase domain-containing protein [Eubacteriales bacterium]